MYGGRNALDLKVGWMCWVGWMEISLGTSVANNMKISSDHDKSRIWRWWVFGGQQELVLLRPPPPQRNQGLISGQIPDLIDHFIHF